jgi:hypothetical protein
VPASPPTNIELEINETCSLETVNTMCQTGCLSNSKNHNSDGKNSIEHHHHQQQKQQKKTNFGLEQSSNHHHHNHNRTQSSNSNDLNNNNQTLNHELISSKTNKNTQIEMCLDKWCSQLKCHVLVRDLK